MRVMHEDCFKGMDGSGRDGGSAPSVSSVNEGPHCDGMRAVRENRCTAPPPLPTFVNAPPPPPKTTSAEDLL